MLRTGRQVGKSTVVAIKAGDFAANNDQKTVLVIASVERQAQLLFEKILAYMESKYKKKIRMGKERPTKSRLRLLNGSVIYCLPTGLTGHGIRGYTVDLLIADEAAFIPETVWLAVSPMLATTKGTMILLSTPFGRGGYFYDCFSDTQFTSFHVTSEECPRIPVAFLENEKKRMTRLQYAQEYLGEFIDELRQFFPTDLIEKRMRVGVSNPNPRLRNYAGCDIARLGGDENVIAIGTLYGDNIVMKDLITSERERTTDMAKRIIEEDRKWNFNRIFVDDGGIGGAVVDILMTTTQTRRKTIGLNNARKSIDREGNRTKQLLKEDMYTNLLRMMEQKKIELLIDDNLALSLKSVQYEYLDDGRIKIFGNYTHIAEALVRMAWAIKSKGLNIWASIS